MSVCTCVTKALCCTEQISITVNQLYLKKTLKYEKTLFLWKHEKIRNTDFSFCKLRSKEIYGVEVHLWAIEGNCVNIEANMQKRAQPSRG